jgi:DNA topoisomerase-2
VHAASRYIFTKLDPLARVLFPQADEQVLMYREEEGIAIEPVHFVPPLPHFYVF